MTASSPDDLDRFLAFADRLADAAREVIKPYFRGDLAVDFKATDTNTGQPVTRADRESEQAIRDLIRATYPDHGIIGEEHEDVNPGAEYCWVLDPIDGTRPFVAGLPMFGTLIGLGHDGVPILGVLDQPVLGERFVGSARGSFLNGRPIRTRPCARARDAVHALTDHRMMRTPAQQAVLQRLMGEVRFTQFGGNCYAYGMLAAGAIDLVTEGDLELWDFHALIPIIEGAGGVITGWDGGPATNSGFIVACGDPALHAEVLPLLQGAV
ncbi:MAG: histidinol-phosphatase [Alphaproteobacteria bacterium]|jgi:myo-inositol-1(or 4)-monophosphatase|nr:histidinol-phosphatase [Alphaproteobacteria bacterium]MDP6516891.1 histidinol-phosphatase [Alphaproteobacteria bacterium]